MRPAGAHTIPPAPAEALEVLGFLDANATPLLEGIVNDTWILERADRKFVLRRYSDLRAMDSIRYEHELLTALAKRGWPIATALPTPTGETVAIIDGRAFAVFPFLEGSPRPSGDRDGYRERGGIMARFHRSAVELLDIGTRPDQHDLRDYRGRKWFGRSEDFESLLAAFARVDPDRSRSIGEEHRLVQRALRERAPGEFLPRTVIHNDLHGDNLLFVGDRLTALLDFDFAHPDDRIADVAITAGFLGGPEDIHALVSGYVGEEAVLEEEFALIEPLRRARQLEHIGFCLGMWMMDNPRFLADLDPTLEMLVRFRLQTKDVNEAVLAAAL